MAASLLEGLDIKRANDEKVSFKGMLASGGGTPGAGLNYIGDYPVTLSVTISNKYLYFIHNSFNIKADINILDYTYHYDGTFFNIENVFVNVNGTLLFISTTVNNIDADNGIINATLTVYADNELNYDDLSFDNIIYSYNFESQGDVIYSNRSLQTNYNSFTVSALTEEKGLDAFLITSGIINNYNMTVRINGITTYAKIYCILPTISWFRRFGYTSPSDTMHRFRLPYTLALGNDIFYKGFIEGYLDVTTKPAATTCNVAFNYTSITLPKEIEVISYPTAAALGRSITGFYHNQF